LWTLGRRAERIARRLAQRHHLLTAVLLVSVLLLIELGLHVLLGNYAITSLYEYQPGDGRCVGLKRDVVTDYTGWLFRISPVHLAVNADGYRGPRRAKSKTDHTYRILLLGDSYTFGQAVNERDTISAQLERILRTCGGRRVEVLNFGVPGLNIEEVLNHYRHFAGQWSHDLALYLPCKNDLDGPLCRSNRRYEILDSKAVQSLNQYFYMSRLVYISYLMAAAANEPSDPSTLARLQSAEAGLVGETRRRGASLGIVMLGDPLLKQFPSGPRWVPTVPMLNVSQLPDSGHVVHGEWHLDATAHRMLVRQAERWIRAEFCGDPSPWRVTHRLGAERSRVSAGRASDAAARPSVRR
jgi:hypothetical protein